MNLAKSFMAWRDSLVESKPKFVWQGCVLGFGVSFGLLFSLALVNSDDIANHPLWEKILFVIGMTVIGGPMTGWLWGQAMWALKPIWSKPNEQLTSHGRRIDELEKRISDLENKNRRE